MSEMQNCPKFLNNLNMNVAKLWNCPKKLKKLNISEGLVRMGGGWATDQDLLKY